MATIVIHSRTKEKISCTYCWEWSLHTFYRRLGGELITTNKLIDKKKALSIIDKLGLVEVHRSADGEIYDTPGGDLKRLFPRGLNDKVDILEISKCDWI